MRARNIVLLIIIVILVLFGILFFVVNEGGVDDLIQPLDRDVSLANYKEFIDKNNYCTIDEDCVGRETYHCLGCYYIVNKNTDFDKIRSLGRDARRGRTSCWTEVACSNPRQEDIECINNKCEVNRSRGFSEDQKIGIFLPDRTAKIKQGDPFKIAFGIKNIRKTRRFTWEIVVAKGYDVKNECGVSKTEAENWIKTGGSGRVEIEGGQIYYDEIRFDMPNGVVDVSECNTRYRLIVKQEDGTLYSQDVFQVIVYK